MPVQPQAINITGGFLFNSYLCIQTSYAILINSCSLPRSEPISRLTLPENSRCHTKRELLSPKLRSSKFTGLQNLLFKIYLTKFTYMLTWHRMRRIEFYNTAVGESMDDLDLYIENRKKVSAEFAETFDSGYEEFKIGVMLRQAREQAGMTQEELATRLHTRKSAISRIENHAEDIRLSTLRNIAEALGKHLEVRVA